MNEIIPAQKKPLSNLFSKQKSELVQDFYVSKKTEDYVDNSQYQGYEISTRFVKIDKNSTSPEMLEHGQIVEEYVEGLPLESPSLTNDVKVI